MIKQVATRHRQLLHQISRWRTPVNCGGKPAAWITGYGLLLNQHGSHLVDFSVRAAHYRLRLCLQQGMVSCAQGKGQEVASRLERTGVVAPVPVTKCVVLP